MFSNVGVGINVHRYRYSQYLLRPPTNKYSFKHTSTFNWHTCPLGSSMTGDLNFCLFLSEYCGYKCTSMSQFESYFQQCSALFQLCPCPCPVSSYVVVAPNELPRHSQIPGPTLTSLTNGIDLEYRNTKK